MGKCKHHPQSSTIPGDGVCPSCLQKKLKTVRWGEADGSAPAAAAERPSAAFSKPKPSTIEPVLPKEAVAILGSIASIKNRNHRGSRPGRDITETALDFVLDSRYTDGVAAFRTPPQDSSPEASNPKSAAVVTGLLCPPSHTVSQSRGDGAAKAGRGWSKSVSTLGSSKSKPSTAKSSTAPTKSLALSDSKSGEPLVDRTAKETARRVIREVQDEMSVTEGEDSPAVVGSRAGRATKPGLSESPKLLNSYFSPSHWQSKLRSKWGIKGPSPITSSNKVFPSKSVENAHRMLQPQFHSPARDQQLRASAAASPARDHRHDRHSSHTKPSSTPQQHAKAASASASASAQETVIVGMPDRILKPEDMSQRLRTSHNTVLQWLEDLPFPETLLNERGGDAGHDRYPRSGGEAPDLIVGHLHEIAEEQELGDEDSSEEDASPPPTNHFSEVSSFGKFLIRAAQRQPREGLSRVQARVAAVAVAAR